MPHFSKICRFGQLCQNMTNLSSRSSQFSSNYIVTSDEVKESVRNGLPVVALESTIITHGMPYPQNFRTALSIEDIIRKNNAVPATIGVLNGKAYIGLSKENLEQLASKKDKPLKISKRDLPYVLSQGMSGGTTVASTMALAYGAGIKVFVTGGIGGVHRDGETTMDVSADLIELSRIPMTVISAGVKSILDIGRTLEYLETHSVCVTTYGPSDDFPAFFTPNSGFKSPSVVQSAEETAQLINARDELGLESGVLIAVPIPASFQCSEIQNSIEQALSEAKLKNISGKAVTPFVLERVQQLSDGAALKANIALIENNARVGSSIAVELSKIKRVGSRPLSVRVSEDKVRRWPSKHRPVVIGGSALDFNITCFQPDIQMKGSSLEGKIESSAGGVARNLADCLAKLEANPFFISAVGSDDNGRILLSKMAHMDTSGIRVVTNRRTATFGVLLNANGECACNIGDTGIVDEITPEQIHRYIDELWNAPLVIIDSNLSMDTMEYIFRFCSENRIPVWVEPTDVDKANKSVQCEAWKDLIVYTSPNLEELRAMHKAIGSTTVEHGDSKPDECIQLGSQLLQRNPKCTVVATLGPLGALLLTKQHKNAPFYTADNLQHSEQIQMVKRSLHYLPPPLERIVSVSGAGDCFAAGMIAAILSGYDQEFCVRAGQMAAKLSLGSIHTVPDSISKETVFHHHQEEKLRISQLKAN